VTPPPAETPSERQAALDAQSYLTNIGGFSRLGLIAQVEFDKFSAADATYGIDSLNVDWNAQACIDARNYLTNVGGFSHQELVDQLVFDQFTVAQAVYGVSCAGL
jgi:hypothetical protein